MTDRPLLVRQVNELRALLDLSYARERALVNALVKADNLLDGAAVAKDKEPLAEDTRKAIRDTLDTLRNPPAPPEGLFIRHAKLVCELAGASRAAEYLRTQLETEAQRNANYEVLVRDLRSKNAELKAEQRALRQLIGDPEITERVMEAARQLMPQPQFQEGDHRE